MTILYYNKIKYLDGASWKPLSYTESYRPKGSKVNTDYFVSMLYHTLILLAHNYVAFVLFKCFPVYNVFAVLCSCI